MPKGKAIWTAKRGTHVPEEKKKNKQYKWSEGREEAENKLSQMQDEMSSRDSDAYDQEKRRKARRKALQKLKDDGWSKVN